MTVDEWLEWAEYHKDWLPVVREAATIIEKQAAEIRSLRAALNHQTPSTAVNQPG